MMETPAIRIAYQGVPGAFSEEALLAHLPHATPLPGRTLEDVFTMLDSGEVDLAFVPVENSHAGSVVESYDLMLDFPVNVKAEWIQPVHHYLLGIEGTEAAQVERVFSHPQALAQTAAFLRQASLQVEPYYDTAGAAQMVAERRDPRYAAVASRLAGERYGLTVLAEGIQTSADNATRFFLLARGAWTSEETVTGDRPGKTSLVFAVEHTPGALVRALSAFARERVNLARLESRPSRKRPWEYLFFTDVEGYAHEPALGRSLRELRRLNPFVRVLGSFPQPQPVASSDALGKAQAS
jgi:prephenate dehydratase/chorismate mutase/prephenate dehydratase